MDIASKITRAVDDNGPYDAAENQDGPWGYNSLDEEEDAKNNYCKIENELTLY